MIQIIKGNLLDACADAIVHQVNCQGVMGAGLALQIKNKYPRTFDVYTRVCTENNKKSLLGRVLYTKESCYTVCNMFAQLNYGKGLQTDYDAMYSCFCKIADKFAGKSVAIPYGLGCGLAGGEWAIVYNMIVKTIGLKCRVRIYMRKEV